MVKILDLYIAKTILLGIFVVLFILTSLLYIFTLIEEVPKITDSYSFESVLLFVLNKMPKLTYEFFPMAVLVGSLLGLGTLSSQSELVVMRAAGLSVRKIIMSTMYTGIAMMAVVFAIGEFLVPITEKTAMTIKEGGLHEQFSKEKEGGFWVKKNENIIHVENILPDKRLKNITIYKSEANRLIEKKEVASAYFNNKWHLIDIKSIYFDQLAIKTKFTSKVEMDEFIDPSLFNILIVPPETLSLMGLSFYVRYLNENNLESGKYEMVFWQKLLSPFSVLIMLMLTIPFVFGFVRNSGVGAKILIGCVIGLSYLMLIDVVAHLGFVFGLPAVISVALPMIFFVMIASFFITRVR